MLTTAVCIGLMAVGIAALCQEAVRFVRRHWRQIGQFLPEKLRPSCRPTQEYGVIVEEPEFALELHLETRHCGIRKQRFAAVLQEAAASIVAEIAAEKLVYEMRYRPATAAAFMQSVGDADDEDTFDRFRADPYVARADARHEAADNGSGIAALGTPDAETLSHV